MVTDLHAHLLPPALADALRARAQRPRISDGKLEMPVSTLAYTPAYEDAGARLAEMDAGGVDRQLLSLPGLFGIDSLPAKEASGLTHLFNDGIAEVADTHSDRFTWLAALPLADEQAAVAELDRALAMGSRGVILPCGAFQSVDGARRLAGPLLAQLEAGGGHLFLHPGRWPDQPLPGPSPYPDLAHARRQIEIQTEIGEAAVTLLYSDLLELYPSITVQIANLGGVLAMVSERITEVITGRGIAAPDLDLRAGRVVFDCASMGPRAIELAAGVFGAGAIALGTDQPIFGLTERLEAIAAANIGPAAQKTIRTGGTSFLS